MQATGRDPAKRGTLLWLAGIFCLAADDLRDALVAHAEDAGNIGHRQAVLVCGTDRLIPLSAKPLGGLLKLGFLAGVVLGESRQALAGLGCLALGARDSRIVCPILANRLA